MLELRRETIESQDIRSTGINPDYWYPIAQSKDLEKNKPLGVTFAGEPIVLVRTETNKVYALEDRCAHRQIPLHLGVVRGEKLQCCYHSWSYDSSGKVVGIPYLPKDQKPPCFKVRSYPCKEAYNLIFIFPGNAEKANQVSFPHIPALDSSHHKTMYFSRKVRCHYSFMHENLMDMNHQFLHRRLMGNIKASLLNTRKGDNWIEVDYKFESVSGKRHFGAELMLGEKDPDPTKQKYDLMTIRTEYPYQILTVRRPSLMDPAFYLWVAYVPLDRQQQTNHTLGLLTIRKPKIPGFLELVWPAIRYFTERIFAEDRDAVEAEQQAFNAQGGNWNNEVYPVVLSLQDLLTQQGIPINSCNNSSYQV